VLQPDAQRRGKDGESVSDKLRQASHRHPERDNLRQTEADEKAVDILQQGILAGRTDGGEPVCRRL